MTEQPQKATYGAGHARSAPLGGVGHARGPAQQDQPGGSTAVQVDAPGAVAPPEERQAPDLAVRVHDARLERQVGPIELTPTEALRLAADGHVGLARRELPPDGTPGGEEREPG